MCRFTDQLVELRRIVASHSECTEIGMNWLLSTEFNCTSLLMGAWGVAQYRIISGARDRNRTGTTLRPRDFLTTSAFAASAGRCSWSGARLHHSLVSLGARRLLSTPSLVFQPGLGSALARNGSRAFAEFDGLHLWSFLQRAQISLSPLCLPISPLGRCAAHAGRQRA